MSLTVPVHSGARQDLEMLLIKFRDKQSLRFTDFAMVFREMNFVDIFNGRYNVAEMYEFAENLLQLAAMYFSSVGDNDIPRSLEERTFGIYATYALYYTQFVDCISHIKVTPPQITDLVSFLEELTKGRHLDAVACVHKLFASSAFKIVAFTKDYDPSTRTRTMAFPELESDFVSKPEPPFQHLKAALNDLTVREMNYLHQPYIDGLRRVGLKSVYQGKNPLEDLQKILTDHEKRLADFQKLRAGIPMNEEIDIDLEADMPSTSAGKSRSGIREKAYSTKTKTNRNRRYADPNMEENFADLNFDPAQLAIQILQEEPIRGRKLKNPINTAQTAGTWVPGDPFMGMETRQPRKKAYPRKKKGPPKQVPLNQEYDEGESEAYQLLVEEDARILTSGTVKREVEEDAPIGGKKEKSSTGARVTAPKRKIGAKIVHVSPKKQPMMEQTVSVDLLGDNSGEVQEVEAKSKKKNRRKNEVAVAPTLSTVLNSQFMEEWDVKLKKTSKEREADKLLELLQANETRAAKRTFED
ncbi:unnamed protein product [Caenorhabditis auriculariae]|uniref:snRNA-activating protein complex subunit 1 n=1 Tax=Caenorhabditis auriculariae TaxID=2777116 RepID=A0A8S1HZ69_9PELO|nr:unnamed protein product [Caenorhabditis auriculariae]